MSDAVLLQADDGSALEELILRYQEARAALDEAQEEVDKIRRVILLRASNEAIAQNATRADIKSRYGNYLVSWTTRKVVDTKRLKAEKPEVWESYAKETGSWQFRAARNG